MEEEMPNLMEEGTEIRGRIFEGEPQSWIHRIIGQKLPGLDKFLFDIFGLYPVAVNSALIFIMFLAIVLITQ